MELLLTRLLIFVSFCGWTTSQNFNDVSNAGTEFYLMFMPNIVERGRDRNAQAIIVSNPSPFDTSLVNVTVRGQPEHVGVELSPMSSVRLHLPWYAVHKRAGLSDRAVHVESSHPVTIIGINRLKYSTDTFLALPQSSLGVGYIGACYTANVRTQIGIVALHADTLIRVTLPLRPEDPDFAVMVEHNGIYYSSASGTPYQFTIRMKRLESYLLTSRGDLTATQIRSNKIISVFSGNVRAKVDGKTRDHMVEQLLPVYAWQSEWYTIPTPNRDEPDVYRILSNVANTKVDIQISDGTNLTQLNSGTPRQFLEVILPKNLPAKFTCSPGKCLVYQISSSVSVHSLGDPSMFMASNPDVFGSYKYIYFTPENNDDVPYPSNKLVILCRERVKPKSWYDKVVFQEEVIDWKPLPLWGLYYGEMQAYTGRAVVLFIESGPPFVLWAHGMSDRESYGHSLGYRISSPECVGSDLSLMSPGDLSLMSPGDEVDNDCDSLIDEEPGIDGEDNDNDGLIDEDVSSPERKLSSGREYLLVFMENRVEYPVRVPMEVFLGDLSTEVSEPAKVTVSYPMPSGGRSEFVTYIHTREVHKIDLNYTVMLKGTGLKSKAIRITSEKDIVVYGINKEQFSADGFLAIPVNSYGKEYFTVSYYPPTSRSEFAVIAPEDDTTVRIFLPPGDELRVEYPGHTYKNGDNFVVRMDALETLQIQDAGGKGDLSGTRIVADKIIGVFSGNVRTFVTYDGKSTKGSRDHLVEQLPPVSSYGTKFAMMTTPGRTVGDVYKMVAAEADTVVVICQREKFEDLGRCKIVVLPTPGSHHTEHLYRSNVYIYMESNKPIMVVQIIRSQASKSENADPVMMLIAPLQQYDKDYTFLTPTLSNPDERQDYKFHYLYVIINASWTDGLMVDDNATSFNDAVWERIPNSPNSQHNLVATYVKLPFALHTLTHTDPAAVYMGLLYGFADRESYGFPIGLKLDILQVCEPAPGVEGDQLDNDCDDLVDEEICGNELDDDNDGRLDEDCAQLPTSYTYLAVFMENNVEYPPANYPLRLYGASYDRQVVRVTTPKYSFRGMAYDRAQVIDSEEILNFGMRPDIRHLGSSRSTRGIVVKSEFPVDLFGSNEEKFSHDCFLVLPTFLLGKEYYTVHASPSTLQQQFAVTPSKDNTSVAITLSSTVLGVVEFGRKKYRAGDTIQLTLDIGESAQVQTKNLPGQGLTGTKVMSSEPIAVFSGNVRTTVTIGDTPQISRDHLVEQLLPWNAWGEVYIAPTTPLREHMDVFIFVIRRDDELIVENENKKIERHQLKALVANTLTLPSGSGHFYVFMCREPFQAVRLTGSQLPGNSTWTDPAMLTLIDQRYWKSRYTFALPVFTGGSHGGDYKHVIQIVIGGFETAGVKLDGKLLQANWTRFTHYSVANVELGHVHQVALSHDNEKPFMAYLYGAADRESYAMPCGVTGN